jgi:predicted Zn-dependent protease
VAAAVTAAAPRPSAPAPTVTAPVTVTALTTTTTSNTTTPLLPPPVKPLHAPRLPLEVARRLDEARALARAGQAEAARTLYTELAEDAHARAKAETALAELDEKAGRYDEAIVHASAAVAAGVGAPAYFVRGLAELRARRPEAAARDFARVLAVQPDNQDAREGLARARAQQTSVAE